MAAKESRLKPLLQKGNELGDGMEGRDTTLDGGIDSAQDLQAWCPPELLKSVAELAPILYKDLKRIAHRERLRVFSPNTMTTTSLVHEAFLKFHDKPGFPTHGDALRVMAVTMRHLLIDRVRAQLAAKRGGGAEHVSLDESIGDGADVWVEDPAEVLSVHDAIRKLAAASPRAAQIVECRYFGGYTDGQIAEALGVTERTVRRDWVTAKAWLAREMGEQRASRTLEPPAQP